MIKIIIKVKNIYHGHMLLLILMVKKFLGCFTRKNKPKGVSNRKSN